MMRNFRKRILKKPVATSFQASQSRIAVFNLFALFATYLTIMLPLVTANEWEREPRDLARGPDEFYTGRDGRFYGNRATPYEVDDQRGRSFVVYPRSQEPGGQGTSSTGSPTAFLPSSNPIFRSPQGDMYTRTAQGFRKLNPDGSVDTKAAPLASLPTDSKPSMLGGNLFSQGQGCENRNPFSFFGKPGSGNPDLDCKYENFPICAGVADAAKPSQTGTQTSTASSPTTAQQKKCAEEQVNDAELTQSKVEALCKKLSEASAKQRPKTCGSPMVPGESQGQTSAPAAAATADWYQSEGGPPTAVVSPVLTAAVAGLSVAAPTSSAGVSKDPTRSNCGYKTACEDTWEKECVDKDLAEAKKQCEELAKKAKELDKLKQQTPPNAEQVKAAKQAATESAKKLNAQIDKLNECGAMACGKQNSLLKGVEAGEMAGAEKSLPTNECNSCYSHRMISNPTSAVRLRSQGHPCAKKGALDECLAQAGNKEQQSPNRGSGGGDRGDSGGDGPSLSTILGTIGAALGVAGGVMALLPPEEPEDDSSSSSGAPATPPATTPPIVATGSSTPTLTPGEQFGNPALNNPGGQERNPDLAQNKRVQEANSEVEGKRRLAKKEIETTSQLMSNSKETGAVKDSTLLDTCAPTPNAQNLADTSRSDDRVAVTPDCHSIHVLNRLSLLFSMKDKNQGVINNGGVFTISKQGTTTINVASEGGAVIVAPGRTVALLPGTHVYYGTGTIRQGTYVTNTGIISKQDGAFISATTNCDKKTSSLLSMATYSPTSPTVDITFGKNRILPSRNMVDISTGILGGGCVDLSLISDKGVFPLHYRDTLKGSTHIIYYTDHPVGTKRAVADTFGNEYTVKANNDVMYQNQIIQSGKGFIPQLSAKTMGVLEE